MITFLNHNLVTQKGDFFSSGIPYMPISLAYAVSYIRKKGNKVKVIDSFGEAPFKVRTMDNYIIQGLTYDESTKRIPEETEIIVVYAGQIAAFMAIIGLIKKIKEKFPAKPLIVIENTQSVVAFALSYSSKELFKAGADYLVTGDPEYRLEKLIVELKKKKPDSIGGVISKKSSDPKKVREKIFITELDELPYPAWDLFPIKNYWKLGYAHGPLTGKKYMPLLTSRGCTLPCGFCVVPETNIFRWRPRDAVKVVDEMEHYMKEYDVNEFHIEDLNPTIRKDRIQDMCKEILNRKLKLTFKFVAGTKIETIDKETITWLGKAGCKYLSLSPESGSPRVLKMMNKYFRHDYALELVEHAHKMGIPTQACFVLGFPGETDQDLKMTKNYIKKLVKVGLDECALFINTPIPGTSTYGKITGYHNFSEMTFSPTWRKDYKKLSKFRVNTYLKFFMWHILYSPKWILMLPFNLIFRHFVTKTEMTFFRFLKLNYLSKFKRSSS